MQHTMRRRFYAGANRTCEVTVEHDRRRSATWHAVCDGIALCDYDDCPGSEEADPFETIDEAWVDAAEQLDAIMRCIGEWVS